MNLLQETINCLKENGKSPLEVLFVVCGGDGITGQAGSWDDFAALAKDINYHNGFGGAEISGGLQVVGTDWWLERGEYDGSEWWEYKECPKTPLGRGPLTRKGIKA